MFPDSQLSRSGLQRDCSKPQPDSVIVNVEGYACIVPFVETDNSIKRPEESFRLLEAIFLDIGHFLSFYELDIFTHDSTSIRGVSQ